MLTWRLLSQPAHALERRRFARPRSSVAGALWVQATPHGDLVGHKDAWR